jgi:dual oxidase
MTYRMLQNVIINEYLPAFLGDGLEPYSGYKADTHPGITHVFQSAAFRFGHTLIPPGIYRRMKPTAGDNCPIKKTPGGAPALRLCATWWDSDVSYEL